VRNTPTLRVLDNIQTFGGMPHPEGVKQYKNTF
jgi:hypothetical protein